MAAKDVSEAKYDKKRGKTKRGDELMADADQDDEDADEDTTLRSKATTTLDDEER